jgi:hypothetical protein
VSGGDFTRDMEELASVLDSLGAEEVTQIADWTMQSASWGVLARIRQSWPILTGMSWGKWGFRKIKDLEYEIYNNATIDEQRIARGAKPLSQGGGKKYAGWVYAKGDRSRTAIAPGIVERAITEESETIGDNFIERLERYIES